jgi:hypothetical protein
MTGLDLDSLRGRWQQQSQRIDTALKLDTESVRALLRARATSSLQRHAHRLGFASVLGALVVAALLAFMLVHRDDLLYLVACAPLLLLALAELRTDVREWRSIRAIDIAAPVVETRAVFAHLRTRRLRMTSWILLLSVLLWLPFLAVTLKGLFGFDLLRHLHWSVAAVNVALGLAIIPVARLLAHRVGRHFAVYPGVQRMLDDLAGRGFSVAYARYSEQAEFEAALASGDAEAAARIAESSAWPNQARTMARHLGSRLIAGALVCASLMLSNGLSMAANGGLVQHIAPGIVLQLTFVLMMVPALIHRGLLAHWVKALTPAQAIENILRFALLRERIALLVVMASPVLLIGAVQVVSISWLRVDLWLLLGRGPALAMLTLMFSVTIATAHRWRQQAPAWARALAGAFCFGALNASRKLAAALSEPKS